MNVVVIVAHGLNCHWLGPYGNEWVATPAFDRSGLRVRSSSIAISPTIRRPPDFSHAACCQRLSNVQQAFARTLVDDRKRSSRSTIAVGHCHVAPTPVPSRTPGEALLDRDQVGLRQLPDDCSPGSFGSRPIACFRRGISSSRRTSNTPKSRAGSSKNRPTEDEEPIDEPTTGPDRTAKTMSLWHRLHNSFAAAVTSFDAEVGQSFVEALRERGLDRSAALDDHIGLRLSARRTRHRRPEGLAAPRGTDPPSAHRSAAARSRGDCGESWRSRNRPICLPTIARIARRFTFELNHLGL